MKNLAWNGHLDYNKLIQRIKWEMSVKMGRERQAEYDEAMEAIRASLAAEN